MARVVRRRTAPPPSEEERPCSNCGVPSSARYRSRWALGPIDLCERDEARFAEALKKADFKKA